MIRKVFITAVALALALGAVVGAVGASGSHNDADDGASPPYEVWSIDQSDTTADGGGTLYIYDGAKLNGDASRATPEKIDIGGTIRSQCLADTGTAPRRPHMLVFNGGHDSANGNTHAALAFVVTGHIVFLNATTRAPIKCIDVGSQAHAVWPSPDQTQLYVANQNGKLLQRISTDYANNSFTLDTAATINLATCTTPSGALCQDPVLRPDNAPICPRTDDTGRFLFVTLRGGGMFVVDPSQTPMAIVAEYDRAHVHPNGCGGVEANGKMYINSGGGTPANPVEHDVFAFQMAAFSLLPTPPNTPVGTTVYSYDARGEVDSHGVLMTRHNRYLWVADRILNTITVVDSETDTVVNEFSLAGAVSADPAPDLMDGSPMGHRVFVALRGPTPLSGGHAAVGTTPGVGVIAVPADGLTGTLKSIAPMTNVVGGVEQADAHAIRVRQIAP